MPVRLQRRRAKGYRLPPGAVYVGRPSKWSNPFRVGERVARTDPLFDYLARTVPGGAAGLNDLVPLDPQRVVDAFAWWLFDQPYLMCSLNELAGKNLACWCPLVDVDGRRVPCHADFLLELANDDELPKRVPGAAMAAVEAGES